MEYEPLLQHDNLDTDAAELMRGRYLASFAELEELLNSAIVAHFVFADEKSPLFVSCFLDPLGTLNKIEVLARVFRDEMYPGGSELASKLRTVNKERGYFAHFRLLRFREGTDQPWVFMATASRKQKHLPLSDDEMTARFERLHEVWFAMGEVLNFLTGRALNRLTGRAAEIRGETPRITSQVSEPGTADTVATHEEG